MKKEQEPEQLDKEAVGRITCRMLQEEGHSGMPLQKLWRLAGMLICLLCITGGLCSAFLSGFGILYAVPVFWMLLVVSVLFWIGFSRLSLEGVYRLLAILGTLIGVSLLLLLLQKDVIAGYMSAVNGVRSRLNEAYDGTLALYQASASAMQMTVFFGFILFLLGAATLAEGITRRRNLKIGFWLFTIAFATSVRCSPLTTVALPDFLIGRTILSASLQESARDFAAIDDLVYDRKDLPQIKAIASWIDTHCAEGEISYMIPHDTLYCPDHFKNCQLPATPINNKLAFGFSVPGTHYFPMQFFEAKYVLTADPFPLTHVNDPENEMSHKLNERFLAVRDEYFEQEATFDMGNGTTFTIWRRTVAPTRAEVEYYLSAFTEEDAKYPEMFSEIAESWLAARGL